MSVYFFEKLFDTFGRPPKIIYEKNANLCQEMIAFSLAVGISIQTPLQNPPTPHESGVYIPIKDIPGFEFGYLLPFDTPLSLPSKIFLNHLKIYISENIDPTFLLT